jgi:hypothetical protein
MEAEKRKNEHDHDDQTDEVNYSIHDVISCHRLATRYSPLLNSHSNSAVPQVRPSLAARVGKQTFVLHRTFDLSVLGKSALFSRSPLRAKALSRLKVGQR